MSVLQDMYEEGNRPDSHNDSLSAYRENWVLRKFGLYGPTGKLICTLAFFGGDGGPHD